MIFVYIQGTHTAMKSGMLAAEAIYPLLTKEGESKTIVGGAEFDFDESIEASAYEKGEFHLWDLT